MGNVSLKSKSLEMSKIAINKLFGFLSCKKIKRLSVCELEQIVFGQQHYGTQDFFMQHNGQYHTIPVSRFPHYIFLDKFLDSPFVNHPYAEYLKCSWDYLYGKDGNTKERRDLGVKKFIEHYNLIRKAKESGLCVLSTAIEVIRRPDGRMALIDGNHRVSIAKKLVLDVIVEYRDVKQYLLKVASVPDEFYGSGRLKMPYQSIFDGDKMLVRGRRPDVLERMKMIEASDLRGWTVLELGCNIGANSYLAAQLGASSVRGVDYSPKLISAAIKLNSYFALPCHFIVHDLNEILHAEPADTVFCFSVIDHIDNKANLTKTIISLTAKVLYFEGHAGSKLQDYSSLLNKINFSKIDLVGYLRDGIHSKKRTRPLYRCERAIA